MKETVAGTLRPAKALNAGTSAPTQLGRCGELQQQRSASEHAFSYLHLMATRVISWGNKAEIISPGLSKTLFMTSFDSVNYDNLGTRPAVEGAPHATGSQVKHTRSQGIVPNGSRASSSVSAYPGAGAAEGSFVRHNKYFFNDGNVTFLVRDIQS